MDAIALSLAEAALLGAPVAYGLGLWACRRERHSLAITFIVLGGLGLRLYAAGDLYLHAWDERFHALVARNLMGHPLRPTLYDVPLLPYDPQNWLENHVWLHKPPLMLWMMASSMAILGVHELALRLPSLVLSAAAIYATYLIGRAWKGAHVGLLAALLQSMNAFLILLAAGWVATDHIDTALIGFVVLAVAAAVGDRRSPWPFVALGALAGLAVLSKGLPGLLPLPVALVWRWRRQPTPELLRGGTLALAVCVVLVVPWWLYSAAAFPEEAAWERAYDVRHFLEPLEGHEGSALFHVWRLPRIYGELVYLPLIWWLLFRSRRLGEPATLALSVWMLLPYLVFSVAASKMPAYVMIAAPAVFLVQAAFCVWMWERRGDGRWRRWAVTLLLGGLVLAPARIVLNDLRLLREHDRRPAWADELRELGRRLAGTRTVIFGSPRPIETMFYTSQTAYSGVPDAATIEALEEQGLEVLVLGVPEAGRAPDEASKGRSQDAPGGSGGGRYSPGR